MPAVNEAAPAVTYTREVNAHTPGPWVAEGWNNLTVNAPAGTIVAMPGATALAPLAEHQSNAALIAAAPDLLAALEVALDTIRTISRRPDPDMEQGAVDRARAAIAKARGLK